MYSNPKKKDENKESKDKKDVKKIHHSSKSSSSDKKDHHKHSISSHHSHRKRSKSRDRHMDHKKSRRSSSSSRTSSKSRSRSVSRHRRNHSHSKSQRRSKSREDYRRNDYTKRNESSSSKRTNYHHDNNKPPKHEAKSVIENKPETENSVDNKMADLLKQIEVPKELRFNRHEAAKYQMEQLRKKTEELTGVKVPGFYNTAAINPLVYAEQQKKRKLLWSKAKDNENTSTGIVGRAIVEGQDEKTAEKFRKLMGIKSTNDTQNNSTLNEKSSTSSDAAAIDQIHKMQAKAFEAMDKEYQFARMASHTHRGMGLGFATNPVVIDPNQIQRAAQLNK